MADYSKQKIALRYWLLGAGYHRAATALEFAESYHVGVRKDGVTPEFAHQIQIASHVRTLLATMRHPEEALCVALLHDVREDYDVADDTIRHHFGDVVADGVDAMTKTFRGVRRDDPTLFARMAECPVASVVKPADRIHNQSTMVGVFTPQKMADYVAETNDLFLPMLKAAKRNFPDQEPVYENHKLMLTGQLSFLEAILGDHNAHADHGD